jgi:predicted ATPase
MVFDLWLVVTTVSLCEPQAMIRIGSVDRVVAEGVYELTVFFVRHQGFIRATSARRISFEDSLVFERLHEQIYRDLGFRLTEVPAGPLTGRVALVQQTIERLRS